MLNHESNIQIKESIKSAVNNNWEELNKLRKNVSVLKSRTKRIQPRRSSAISLVGTDGGNNRLSYDPFSIDLIRVVDSSDNEYCLEAITPMTHYKEIDSRHFDDAGKSITPLGRMLKGMDLNSISEISSVIAKDPSERSPIWVQIYRELTEWAVLLDLIQERQFGNDTVILFDGFLRSKKFDKGLFRKYKNLLVKAISTQYQSNRRRIYVAGIAKKNKFLQKYRLAMALEGVLRNSFPCFVPVDEELQKSAYIWEEIVTGGGEKEGFTAGKMYLVKFGSHIYDPIWAIDILDTQTDMAPTILGYLLVDSEEGFPIPHYPMCLQQAHEKAALVGLDYDIFQDEVIASVRESIGDRNRPILDELSLQPVDPSAARY